MSAFRVRFPFGLKLALALVALAVLSGVATRVIQYGVTRGLLLESMQGRLSDVAHAGSHLFDEADRGLMVRFGAEVRAAMSLDPAKLDAMQIDENLEALEPAQADAFMQRPEFLRLVQKLRAIKLASTPVPEPLGEIAQNARPAGFRPQISFAYLYVPIPGNQRVVMFLADSDYQTLDTNGDGEIQENEEGNPIGNLYVPEPFFTAPFTDGRIHVSPNWYTDQWGTFISASVPLKDAAGQVVAVLGVDYLVESEANKLNRLIWLAVWLTLGSVVITALLSWWIARVLTRPVARLAAAAEQVGARDFSVRAPVISTDELGALSTTFNQMVDEIQRYAGGLEQMVEQRTLALAQANREISELNARLRSENSRMSAELEVAHRLQSMVLPKTAELRALIGFDVAACMFPAAEVGGDYFDLLMDRDGSATLAMGDVSGHGLESGVVMLMVQSALRALTLAGTDEQTRQYDLLNRLVIRNCARIGTAKSMTLALIDMQRSGALSLVGQHDSPLLVRADGGYEWIDTVDLGLPLGLDEDIEAFIGRRDLVMAEDDLLFLYTDGITEAENEAGEAFGTERLSALVVQHRGLPSADLIERVLVALYTFVGSRPLDDDVSLLAVKRRATVVCEANLT